MQEPIVKAFIGRYIDLRQVVAISEAKFYDRMGSGGYYVGFDIHIKMLDKPIHHERKLTYTEERELEQMMPEGARRFFRSDVPEHRITAVISLQKQIDELVQQWKAATYDDFSKGDK